MINISNINEARREIQRLKKEGKEVVVLAQDDGFNRKSFENKDVDMIVGLEFNKKDKLKQRDSGLNEVLCKLAKANDIKIGIDIDKISKLDKIEKARVLARVGQNIGLCKRVGVKLVVLGIVGTVSKDTVSHSKQEVMSFFLSLRGSTAQVKN